MNDDLTQFFADQRRRVSGTLNLAEARIQRRLRQIGMDVESRRGVDVDCHETAPHALGTRRMTLEDYDEQG